MSDAPTSNPNSTSTSTPTSNSTSSNTAEAQYLYDAAVIINIIAFLVAVSIGFGYAIAGWKAGIPPTLTGSFAMILAIIASAILDTKPSLGNSPSEDFGIMSGGIVADASGMYLTAYFIQFYKKAAAAGTSVEGIFTTLVRKVNQAIAFGSLALPAISTSGGMAAIISGSQELF